MAAHPQSFQGLIPCRADGREVADEWGCRSGRRPDRHLDRTGWLRAFAAALLGCLLLTLLQGLASPPAHAQGGYADAAYGEPGSIDPPGRVGWLSYVEGRVELGRDDGDDDEGEPAELNWPITAGDRLFADRRSRFEMRVGSIALRADDGTEIAIRTLDDERLRVEQAGGTLAISFQNREQAEGTEVHTPFGRVDFALPGDYRIDVRRRAGQLVVTTFRGAAYVHADGLSVAVPEGRRAEILDGGDDYVIRAARADAFDDWVRDREVRDDRGRRQARAYVSPEMTGAESLAAYGGWTTVAGYGVVWTPYAQPVGWAPYRHGRWAWVHPWGWTWIDAAPWGFAPFHYGRWAIIHGRWSWIPGDHAFRPVYAPALVVWVGGSNWSFSFSSGPAVGWFPLGPREVYVPPRHFSDRYAYRVNRPSVSERAIETAVRLSERPEALREQRFRHRDEPRAVTIVPERTLSFGQAVQRQAIQLRDRREWRDAPVHVAPALQPAPAAERPRRGGRDNRVEARDDNRREAREQVREQAQDALRGGRNWRERAEQIAAPPGAPPQPGRRPEAGEGGDAQGPRGLREGRVEREGREDRQDREGRAFRDRSDEGGDPRAARRGRQDAGDSREFRPRQPGPPPGQPAPQGRPLAPQGAPKSMPPSVQPHAPAAIPATPAAPPIARPLRVVPAAPAGAGPEAGGSPVDRAREQARRQVERERAPEAVQRGAARREEWRDERREERREVRSGEPRQRGSGAGQSDGEGDAQAQGWRKRLDPRRQEERP